jgi:hypothetical protein
MISIRKFVRRKYENVALVAVRKSRQLVLFWTRRGRKSTTLGSISFDEMSGTPGRTVIAASASLLLGKEIVGMTLGAAEQAAIVTREAQAVKAVFENGAAENGSVKLQVAKVDNTGDKLMTGLTEEDFAALYSSSNMEMRLYFDRTRYSRLKIIAPNPATARGWGGTVLRDEAGYTPANLENELRVATKPIMDTDPTFKLIYASNLCPNDRHPFFEMTMPPADMEFPPNPNGHFYRGQNGILIHRVALADAYAAGHVLYDDHGNPLTLPEFRALPGNKLGLAINYDLVHQAGGTAAIDLISLLTAQRRGKGCCSFVFVEDEDDFKRACLLLRENLTHGPVGIGFDVATTTRETSNPSAITVTEKLGTERFARLVLVFKSKKRQVMKHYLEGILDVVRERPEGGPARRLCIDASNERLAAEETADDLAGKVPTELVVAGMTVQPQPPGYDDQPVNYKTLTGDIYATAVNENQYALPPDEYIKVDQRLPMKDQGRFVCDPDSDGRHGDTFDSGKLSERAVTSSGGAITTMAGIKVGGFNSGTVFPRMPAQNLLRR